MKNMKKQTVAVAMATVLGLSPALDSNIVYALENDNPENDQKTSQEISQKDKKQAPEINVPKDLKGTEGQKLTEIPLVDGWSWSNENQLLSLAIKEYSVQLLVDDNTYDYSSVEGYNSEGHFVERSVSVQINENESKKQNTLAPEINIPQGLKGTSGQKLSEILLLDGWTWNDENQLLNPTIKEYSMRLLVDDNTYDYSAVEGYHSKGHYVERNVPVNVIEGNVNLIQTIKPKLNASVKVPTADPDPDMTAKFKDQKFINKLLSLCDKASGGNNNGKLELSELKKIRTLSLRFSDNMDLTGIEYLENLITFDAINSKLIKVDLSKNLNLYTLNLSGSTVQTVTLGKNTKLKSIDANDAPSLVALDVSECTNLVTLSCYNTKISKLNLTNSPELIELFCYGGYKNTLQIKELDLRNNKKLTELNVSRTTISDLKIENCTNLEILNISETLIENIDLSPLKKLEDFSVADTPLQNLNVDENKELSTLRCNGTLIPSLNVQNNEKLSTLTCNETKLIDLDLQANTELTTLYCDSTKISNLNLKNNKKLKDLSCNDNDKLFTLDLSANIALETLNCSSTMIEQLDLTANTLLTRLYCDNTKIKELDLSNKTELYDFICQNGSLEGLDISSTSKISSLYLSNTPIAWLNVGKQPDGARIYLPSPTFNLDIKGSSFTINDYFKGIDPSKVTITDNGTIDKRTGIVSGYVSGKPMTYSYNCGEYNDGRPVVLKVTINISKRDSTIKITEKSEFEYTGNPISDPTYDKTGSDGNVTYSYEKWNGSTWEAFTDTPKDVGTYQVTATLAENNEYRAATSLPHKFIIKKASNTWISEPLIANWTYDDPASKPAADAKFGNTDLEFTFSDKADSGFTNKVPSNAGTWYMKAFIPGTDNYSSLEKVVPFEIAKASNAWISEPLIANWTFGDTASVPSADAKYGNANLKFSFSDKADSGFTDKVPSNAGTWYMKAFIPGTDNYSNLEKVVPFEIAKASNTWISEPSITNWVYGDTASVPSADAKYGNASLEFTFSDKADSGFTDKIPSNVGTWYMKASIPATGNYPNLEKVVLFEITKASNAWISEPLIANWVYGDTASKPLADSKFGDVKFMFSDKADSGFTDKVPSSVGTWYMKASVSGTDNYSSLEKVVPFEIMAKNINTNKDIAISDISSESDIDKLVVKDAEKILIKGIDYDVEKKTQKNKMTVTIRFKGNYTGSITRSFTVKRIKPVTPSGVETGDHTATGLFAALGLLSAGCMAASTGKKRRRNK